MEGLSDTHCRIFTDSQAAMVRVQSGGPGPGQSLARRAISLARALVGRGISASVHWVLGRCGIYGNELADAVPRDAATRASAVFASKALSCSSGGSNNTEVCSMAFLKAYRTKKASEEWRGEILRRNQGRSFRVPAEGSRPRIPVCLGRTPKEVASRFFQLASGHAMIAPFLRSRETGLDG